MTDSPNILKFDVVAENGVPFRTIVMINGKSENFKTSSMNDRTMVEFYDRRHSHTPDGQFTGARYYLDDLLSVGGGGIELYRSVDDWTLDGVTWKLIRQWLYFLVDRELVKV